MIVRGENAQKVDLDICGSSTFGRYAKISACKTYNMFLSDNWLVDYAGYLSVNFGITLGSVGRGIFTSTKFNRQVAVIDSNVYLLNIFYDQDIQESIDTSFQLIGNLTTSEGVVYITENNKPQVVISDAVNLYYYDPSISASLMIAKKNATTAIDFTPGYISFHNGYILCAASQDNYFNPPASNTYRLGVLDTVAFPNGTGNTGMNTGALVFPDVVNGVSFIGTLERKPDNVQAVVPFPSRGNMVIIIGEIVAVPAFDVGTQIFPYESDNKEHYDYGCLNPATVAYSDEIVVWLAQNEKSGPIIVYSRGGELEKITTDGIDYLFSQLQNPSDSQGFLYRQDGHLIYHINFYSDNLSLFYDFNTQKFFHACDENGNYFIAAQIAFFNNQYYFVSKNSGKIYAFDTIYTTYDGAAIPRRRICSSLRAPDQQYRILNDVGFTIEQGSNNPNPNRVLALHIASGGANYTSPLLTIVGGNGIGATATATLTGGVITSVTLINPGTNFTYTPTVEVTDITGSGAKILATLTNSSARIDLSISRDGGQTFENRQQYILNPNGNRPNKLMWWNCGIANDAICQFEFIGLGRFIAYNGEAWLRQ